ncbi:MAG: UDP-N-acetylmuramoyl-tripeptide--D-alanyl-D-alanine ligase [Opitutaceae bacterium]|nr:UDP-N-acetylmuramoyl-tripeptide--D-alanyl-D-alanine ligase [Opitutaceae bacterium]
MPTFSPEQLATWSGGRWTARPERPLAAFNFDTRQLRAGDVFVAIKTEKRDGHAFLAAAAAAGASAALVAAPDAAVSLPQLVVAEPLAALHAIARAWRRAFRGPVVGISGSAGKTSTKDLLALLLGGATSGVVATEGNLNNLLGVPLTLARLDPAAHRCAVIEAGISVPGEMAQLAAMIEPDVAIITLVAPAHTEALGGLEGVAREKALLPAAVRPGGVAIFPRQAAEFAPFRALKGKKIIVSPAGAGPGADVAFTVAHRDDETELVLTEAGGAPASFRFRRVSDGMAQNAALAITAARGLGVSPTEIQARLPGWKTGKLRAEVRRIDGRLVYLDCYNANPASMHDALSAFEEIAPAAEPRLYVIGCMAELGDEAAAHHRALGRRLRLRDRDRLLVIGEEASVVCAGVLDQGDFSRQIQIASAPGAVAEVFAGWRGAVFVKGSRRYELEKIIEGRTSLPLPC